jgi:molybdopterin-guanine dinucleotide biosynthesis protein A
MTTEAPRTLGVLLAGGLARRMGGGDKPLKPIAGRSILERAIARLAPRVTSLILNANGDPARFAAFGLVVVPDGVPDYPGPLAGVLAALDHAAAYHPNVEWVVSASADSPFLPADLVMRLHGERGAHPLACAASGGHTHPPIGLWRVALRDDLRRALVVEGERKIDRWTARHGCAAVEWATDPVDPFFNANTPEDLAEAEAILARHPEA